MNKTAPRDFKTEFGVATGDELLLELKKWLAESDSLVVFRNSYKWYHHSNLDENKAREHFQLFKKTGELPFYVKRRLFYFRGLD